MSRSLSTISLKYQVCFVLDLPVPHHAAQVDLRGSALIVTSSAHREVNVLAE